MWQHISVFAWPNHGSVPYQHHSWLPIIKLNADVNAFVGNQHSGESAYTNLLLSSHAGCCSPLSGPLVTRNRPRTLVNSVTWLSLDHSSILLWMLIKLNFVLRPTCYSFQQMWAMLTGRKPFWHKARQGRATVWYHTLDTVSRFRARRNIFCELILIRCRHSSQTEHRSIKRETQKVLSDFLLIQYGNIL